jgi:hypothetical protein
MADLIAEHILTPGLDPAQVLGLVPDGLMKVLCASTVTWIALVLSWFWDWVVSPTCRRLVTIVRKVENERCVLEPTQPNPKTSSNKCNPSDPSQCSQFRKVVYLFTCTSADVGQCRQVV